MESRNDFSHMHTCKGKENEAGQVFFNAFSTNLDSCKAFFFCDPSHSNAFSPGISYSMLLRASQKKKDAFCLKCILTLLSVGHLRWILVIATETEGKLNHEAGF